MLGNAGARPLRRGVADPEETLLSHTCYHTKFRPSGVKPFGRRCRKMLGTLGPRRLGMRVWWLTPRNMLLPSCVTTPNSVTLDHSVRA